MNGGGSIGVIIQVSRNVSNWQKKLQEVIEREEAAGRIVSRELSREDQKASKQFHERMDINDQDIIIQGTTSTRVSRKQVSTRFLLYFSVRDENRNQLAYDWCIEK